MTHRGQVTLQLLLAPERAPDAIDWTGVSEDAELLSVDSLLYSSVRRAGRLAEVPDLLRARLQRAHATSTAHNLEMAVEVRALASALAAARVPWAPLKGAALLALDAYRDFGARPTSDIDIITSPADRDNAEQAITSLGYTQLSYGGSKHLPPFERGNLLVEVHESAFWRLGDGAPTPLVEMRDAAGRPRLEQTVAHLVHHALESSVPTPMLLVKTLCDLDEVRRRTAGNDLSVGAIAAAAASAGLGEQLAAFTGALALIGGHEPNAAWAGLRWRELGGRLLSRCAPLALADADALRVAARASAMIRQPLPVTLAFLRSRLLPARAALEEAYGLRPGSPLVAGAWALHVGRLALRSGDDARRLIQLRRRRR